MKRMLSLAICLVLVFSIVSPVIPASAAVTPTPPSWVRPQEYAVFAGGVAYEAENWENLLLVREYAQAGGLPPI